ncbi:MAG: transcriptional regulator [Phycisphaerae bacterium]|nr:transcriptional regulator [Phycisphaerae bacterium]
MKRSSLADAPCPIARGYNAIGDWWSLLVVTHVVLLGRGRFSQIQDELGIAKNILSSRLRKLVDEGILEREAVAEGGNRQVYVATEKGRELYKVLVPLMQWGQTYFFEADDCPRELVDRSTGLAVAEVSIRSADGRELTLDDLRVLMHDGADSSA